MLALTDKADSSPKDAEAELDQLHRELDGESAWKLERQIDETIARMGLEPKAPFETLASGMKRRVLLA